MKKAMCLILVGCFFLSACAATASSGVLPSQGNPNQPSTSPVGSEATQGTEPVHETFVRQLPDGTEEIADWENDPVLQHIPQPPEGIVFRKTPPIREGDPDPNRDNKRNLYYYGKAFEQVETYIQQLKDAGFVWDVYKAIQWAKLSGSSGEVEYRRMYDPYVARNDQGIRVTVRNYLGSYAHAPEKSGYYWQIVVDYVEPLTPPADALVNDTSWNADPLRALVPQPECPWWVSKAESAGSGEDTYSTVELPYMKFGAFRTYVEELKSLGFCWNAVENLGGAYSYKAQNPQGNKVELRYNREEGGELSIYGTGSRRIAWTGEDWLEPPEGVRWNIRSSSYRNIYMDGLDFQEAIDYVNRLYSYIKGKGYKLEEFLWREDQQEQTLLIWFTVQWQSSPISHSIVYDPETEYPLQILGGTAYPRFAPGPLV